MKKFTLLQSAFALIAAFMLALPARAQVASAADLYGTYKFTATVNVTEAGQALKDNFKEECEVKITKCSIGVFDGEIVGFAGAANAQSIYSVDVNNNTITIRNPNGNYDIWDGKVHMSNAEGIYPYGGAYGDIVYTFDPATKTITLPDFTLVTVDHANSSATIAANFTNAKMTLVEAENVNVTDLSGNWHFKAVTGGFNTMENSTLPTEWDMTLTASDDTKKAYNISLTLGDFAPLALTGSFDGVTLTIPFNETYFDAENKIGIVNMYGVARPGEVTFNLLTENSLSLTSGMTIAQDSISPEVKGGYLQWYMAGTAKRESGELGKTFDWSGIYKVKAEQIYPVIPDYEYPTEFEMEIILSEYDNKYYVSSFMGNRINGFEIIPDANDPTKAVIAEGVRYVKTIEGGVTYLTLGDMNGTEAAIDMTVNEDGTVSISAFTINLYDYATKKGSTAGAYMNITMTKKVVEPFDWAKTFTVKATEVYSINPDYEYPAEFEIEIIYSEYDGNYYVSSFMGNRINGFRVIPDANDPSKAVIEEGVRYIKTIEGGVTYLTLGDMNGTEAAINMTVGEDGTVTLDNITILLYDYASKKASTAGAYTGVTMTKGASSIEENVVEVPALKAWSANGTIYVAGEAQYVEVYDMSGRTVFAGVASEVNGLNKGLYLVKVKNAVAKVAVK